MKEKEIKANPLVETARCKAFSDFVYAAANAVRNGVANYVNIEMNDSDNRNWSCEVTVPATDPDITLTMPQRDPIKDVIDAV